MEQRIAQENDVFFYPYLAGANYPVWQPAAKGTFTGFDLSSDKFDFARAIMEGVAFGLKRALADFEKNGCPVRSLKTVSYTHLADADGRCRYRLSGNKGYAG